MFVNMFEFFALFASLAGYSTVTVMGYFHEEEHWVAYGLITFAATLHLLAFLIRPSRHDRNDQ